MVESPEAMESSVGVWRAAVTLGNELLDEAGSVEEAAKALWQVREETGRNNLAGVDSESLDGIIEENTLAYMRDVREFGMSARYTGERNRVRSKPHPNARANMGQVYKQVWKDVGKARALVVDSGHKALTTVVASPFEAVDKMNPDRTISEEKRLVHDQRQVNQFSHKTVHPPANQPKHAQVARLILYYKRRYPGITVLLAKKDAAGAFRLLWTDPCDVELFAGDLPWQESAMGDQGSQNEWYDSGIWNPPEGVTVIFLVASFGFSGSPGEWSVWGKATEFYHSAHMPSLPRRDGSEPFDGKILVDDAMLVEPWIGARPWMSGACYEEGVVTMLGQQAINKEKDKLEGCFEPLKTVWGLDIDAEENEAGLPDRRILKGAYLLTSPVYDPGCKSLTLRDVQRARGTGTGWTTVVPGLRNELTKLPMFSYREWKERQQLPQA